MVLYCNLERTFVVTDVLYTGLQPDKCNPLPRSIPIYPSYCTCPVIRMDVCVRGTPPFDWQLHVPKLGLVRSRGE